MPHPVLDQAAKPKTVAAAVAAVVGVAIYLKRNEIGARPAPPARAIGNRCCADGTRSRPGEVEWARGATSRPKQE